MNAGLYLLQVFGPIKLGKEKKVGEPVEIDTSSFMTINPNELIATVYALRMCLRVRTLDGSSGTDFGA